MSLATKILIAVAIFIAGGFAGNYVSGRLRNADAVSSAEATTAAITTSVNRQIAVRQAELTRQQGLSLGLTKDLVVIRASAADIRMEISNARFDPPANAGACPDAVGSDEFVRLYGEAAHGRRAAANPTSTGAR